ncbi:hypothetical protein [uncultured Fibrobacter sp.]|uniref:hypothetical protein n=1 Tax=uncultured Fibrobacter sp. TaxID=261512 RepID=UPI00261C525C|nr:hypothetical protein [uncultured Fibrobacter sp.]MBR6124143.1 hypothetical protein [Candidatus Saccharibacteria bacterium]
MSLRLMEKCFPSEYRKVEKEADPEKKVYFVRESSGSIVLAMLRKVSRKDFLPEVRSSDGTCWLRSLESEVSCIVDFRDVELNGVLCRYYITRDQLENGVYYFLDLYMGQGRRMARLFVSGVERGNSYQREPVHEDPFYDELYPEHPLTQLRLLAKSLVYKASAKGAA